MDKIVSETLALILMFVAFPLTSKGATDDNILLLSIGFLCVIAGGVLPIITRFMDHSNDKVRDAGVEFDDRAS
ncbi:EmrB/QacA subfamily drug resistance transporter [Paraburkholderia dinghuensis]|uniref:EmrB/QacA subfamily drug resistance transporter n=1 Tax=Paraburkholderia dinghuensis TaxID=2305225 RepID=A0A3N6N1R7_9BURK|nr:EmrB/QacA subfamily drug resistance transporter [Paraburkholderia dinghuensis]RQH09989.1 EmrB/QacA subfamily drug resistance transporter [Paraburkholderia dinghuensis]